MTENSESQIDFCQEEIEERILKSNGDEIVKIYSKGKFLGKGGFAKCYEFKCKNNNKLYAAKIVSKSNLVKIPAKQKLKSEIKIHKSLHHPNIVKFEHVFEDKNNVYILLEICKNKTLNEMLKKRKVVTEMEVKFFLDQILKAVKFMHKNKVIHRDLKLGNLFLGDNMQIKIGDFGLATIIEFQGQLRHTICGTPNYIAPEILEGKSGGHSYEVDLWAIGVIIFTLLTGRPPFETDDVKETYKRIKINSYKFPDHILISQDAKDLIKSLLIIDPKMRLKIDDIKKHSFMTRLPIAKSLPNSVCVSPPDSSFVKSYLYETNQIKTYDDISRLIEDDELYNEIISIAKSNIKSIDCNVVNHEYVMSNEELNKNIILNQTNSDYSMKFKKNVDSLYNMKYLSDYQDLSFSKKYNKALRIKSKKLDKFPEYIIRLFDKSSTLGYMFITSKKYIGILLIDSSSICKKLDSNEAHYKNINGEIERIDKCKNHADEKINLSLDILNKFEKYILEHPHINITSEELEEENYQHVYIKKVIKSNLAFMLKLSNGAIQLIFFDESNLIIIKKLNMVIFLHEKQEIQKQYDLHTINKVKDKKMQKRYEHYKKIFYEQLEERFSKKQHKKQGNNSNEQVSVEHLEVDVNSEEINLEDENRNEINITR